MIIIGFSKELVGSLSISIFSHMPGLREIQHKTILKGIISILGTEDSHELDKIWCVNFVCLKKGARPF